MSDKSDNSSESSTTRTNDTQQLSSYLKENIIQQSNNRHNKRELEEENARLQKENQSLLILLNSSCQREECLVNKLADAQVKIDNLEFGHETDRLKIKIFGTRHRDLNQTNPDDMYHTFDNHDKHDPKIPHLIWRLETEIDNLRTDLRELTSKNNSSDQAWRAIETLRDQTNTQLDILQKQKQIDELRTQLEQAKLEQHISTRQIHTLEAEIQAIKQAHEDYSKKSESYIRKLTKQTCETGRHVGRQKVEQIREKELTEIVQMQALVNKLRNDVEWLKYHSQILKQTSETLKHQLKNYNNMQLKLARARGQIKKLNHQLTVVEMEQKRRTSSEEQTKTKNQTHEQENLRDQEDIADSIIRKDTHKMLQLQIENRRLYRKIELLRLQILRADPTYRLRYAFVTGV